MGTSSPLGWKHIILRKEHIEEVDYVYILQKISRRTNIILFINIGRYIL